MSFSTGVALQSAMCRAIGVDPKQTSRIVIDVAPDRAVRARVSMYLTTDQQDELVKIFDAVQFEEATPTK